MKGKDFNPELAALVEPEETKTEVFPGMTVEEIKAVYFNADALREPPYRVFQLNSDGYRYYYRFEDGEPVFFPSVTTLLKQVMPTPPALLEWMLANGKDGATEKRDLAAAYGTFMHIQFESLIINRTYDFDAVPAVLAAYMERENLPERVFSEWIIKIRKDVLAFAQFVKDYNIKPLAIEIGLVHPDYHFAGCIDLPCIMTDPKTGKQFAAIVDFKSGRKGFYEEHELQLHLYKTMWNVNFPDVPVSRLFNFSPKDWRTKPTYNLKDQTDAPSQEKLPHLLALAAIADASRDNDMTIIRGILDLDNGKIMDNVLTLSLAELIKSKAETKDVPKNPVSVPEISENVPEISENVPEVAENVPKVSENVRKRAVNRKTVAGPVNTPSESEKAVTREIQDKLPWEKDIADGTGIEVEKTDDGVKVTARYFEPAPERAAKDNLLNDEIEL